MATGKVNNCFSSFPPEEFAAVERAVAAAARAAGRAVPLNKDYLDAARAEVTRIKQQIAALEAGAAARINEDVLGPEVPLNRDVLGRSEPRNARLLQSASAEIPGDYAGPVTEVTDVDAFLADNPGVRVATERLELVGLGYAFEQVDGIYIAEDSAAFGAAGSLYYDPKTGNLQLWFARETLNNQPHAKFTTIHEMTHVVDGAFGGEQALDQYSRDPRLGVSDLLIPTGSVSRALDAEVAAETDIGEVMKYPLETVQSRLSTSEEIFAQLFTLALINNDVAAQLPPVAQRFIKEVVNDASKNGEGHVRQARLKAARETRASGSKTRYGEGASKRGVPAQVAQPSRGGGPTAGGVKPTGIPSVDRAEGRINSALQSLKDGASWTGIRAMFTEDLLNLAKKVLPDGNVEKYQAAMAKIEVNKGRMERDVQKILQDFQTLPAHERGTGPGSVNALIMDSTVNRAWAFKPTWLDAKTPVDPAYATRFNLLSPGGQALVKRVFEHGYTTLQQMQAAVRNNVTAEFDSEIAEAKAAGDAALVKKLTKKKDSELRDFKTLLDMGGGWPYAPLKRFGKYVVMGYSAQYQAAKDAGNVPEMQRLQKDGAHYHVAFAETQREARTLAAQLEPQFPGGAATHFEKLEGVEEFMGGRDVMGAFQRLRSVVADKAAGDDGKTDARLNDMMRQLYLTLLAEGSARKSELNRKTVAGANEDMMRAFATQGRATAHFIAGLQTNGSVNDALMAMKKEAGRTLAGRTEKQAYFNEILRRHSMNLEFTPTGLLDKVMAGTSIWMLLTNPSYFLLNMTQPYMMSSPLMGARYGYAKTHAAMFQAYREVAPTLKDAKFTEDDYSAMPPDVRQAIEELANQGVIDISLDSVLGDFESSSDKSAPGRALDYAVQRMRGAAQGVESLNRLATAIAAYRLAKERSGHEGAVKYAAQVIYETHGDYSGYNAPRFMRRGVGRLATQFRKFQLIQISMFARLLHTAFKDASKEERFVARKALAFNLAHLGAMGGLMGLPAFGAIAWMLGAIWPNDDEPDDPEATLRRLIGNNELADLLLKGAPKLLGVDVSGRIGAGGMLSLFPYTDLSATREGYANAMIALGGPFIGGLMPKVVDGLGLIASGEYWKGSEQLLPSGLGNVMRATRFNEEGVTRRNGDVVLSPDEINLLTWASQAVGLPSNTLSDRTFLANAQFKSDTFYRERTSKLKREYSEAVRNNDTAAMREAREDWLATQVARRELGFSVQPLSELLRAPREQLKRERSTIGGVQTRASNEGFVEALQ